MAFEIVHLFNLKWNIRELMYSVLYGFSYRLSDLRSLISTFRKGRNAVPQNGQVLLRLESSAVQPAMISSSYTRHSHVLQREQLDISTYQQQQDVKGKDSESCSREAMKKLVLCD